jgi:hypothetical protein
MPLSYPSWCRTSCEIPSYLVPLNYTAEEATQGPYERDPELIGVAEIGSGEKLAGRDLWVACPTRSPHETALLHPLLHLLGAATLHPPRTHSRRSRQVGPVGAGWWVKGLRPLQFRGTGT